MTAYTNIENLKEEFAQRFFPVADTITVGDDEFKLATMQVNDNVYALYESEDNWLILSWTPMLDPRGLIQVSMKEDLTEGIVSSEQIIVRPEQLIGNHVDVRFSSISNSEAVKGKVDTGATISSLHADEWKIVGDVVEFTSNVLSGNVIRLPVANQNAVKTADGGVEYRPVVVLNVEINGKKLSGVEFNLNDRSHMDDPVLIGQNALQKGKFLIDPAKQVAENIDWGAVSTLIEQNRVVIPSKPTYSSEQMDQLYKLLLETDVPISSLIRHIKTQLIYTIENDIKY